MNGLQQIRQHNAALAARPTTPTTITIDGVAVPLDDVTFVFRFIADEPSFDFGSRQAYTEACNRADAILDRFLAARAASQAETR